MKKLLLALTLSVGLLAQTPTPPGDRLILTVPTPQGPSSVTAGPVGLTPTGAVTYYYFVVAILPSGKSAPSAPVAVYNMGPVGSAGFITQLNWTAVPFATGYDVLRTTTPYLPSPTCVNCQVKNNIATTSATDTIAVSGVNYTTTGLGSFGASVETLNVTNTQYADARVNSSLPLVVPKLCFTDTTCQTTAGGGGGGASSQAQLTDWQTTVGGAGTTLNNTSCSVTTPCDGRTNQHTYSPYTAQPYVSTLTPGAANANCGGSACNGNIYEYIDQSGVWTFLYGNGNMAAGSLVCGAGWTCTQQNVITEFPNGACGLYVWTVNTNVIASSPTLDSHGVACSVPAFVQGTGIGLSGVNPITITNTSPGAASSGGNGVFQQSNGSGGFSPAPCTNAFGVVTCTQSVQNNNGFAIEIGQGFGITTCATTATLQPGGWNVINVTGNCTLSIAAPGVDGIGMELLICEDGVGGHTIAFPASFVGTGTPQTTANKCNYQLFRGSNLGGTLGGHTVNATWFAAAPMASY